jgi:hypothetical protein
MLRDKRESGSRKLRRGIMVVSAGSKGPRASSLPSPSNRAES